MLRESPQTKPPRQNTMVHARKNTTKTWKTPKSQKILQKSPENRPRIQKSQKSPERTPNERLKSLLG
nr:MULTISPECIES: hypothetical protein [Methanothermobacter]